MKSIFQDIYLVNCPCEIRDSGGNLLYIRFCKKNFIVPLPGPDQIKVLSGSAVHLGKSDNFFNVTPPPAPKNWDVSIDLSDVGRVAEILIDYKQRQSKINLDTEIFEDPNIPEGCKIFMVYHEIGHLIHGPNEKGCDEFAFYHALRAGVSPFLCFVALAAFMPDHYLDRVENMGNVIKSNPQLKKYTDGH